MNIRVNYKVYLWVLFTFKKIAPQLGPIRRVWFSFLITSLPPCYSMVICVNRRCVVGNLNMESKKDDFAA